MIVLICFQDMKCLNVTATECFNVQNNVKKSFKVQQKCRRLAQLAFPSLLGIFNVEGIGDWVYSTGEQSYPQALIQPG